MIVQCRHHWHGHVSGSGAGRLCYYAVAGTFIWRNSLAAKLEANKAFYSIITAATFLGVLICFSSIDPLKLCFGKPFFIMLKLIPTPICCLSSRLMRQKLPPARIGSPTQRLNSARPTSENLIRRWMSDLIAEIISASGSRRTHGPHCSRRDRRQDRRNPLQTQWRLSTSPS